VRFRRGGATTACHPEAQAHRTCPHITRRGPKDLACATSQLGRGSGHSAEAATSGRFDRQRRMPRLPSPPGPLSRKRERGRPESRFGSPHALDCACSPRRRTLCRSSRDFSRPSRAEASAVVPAAAPMVVSCPRLDPSARVVRRTGRYGEPAPQDDRSRFGPPRAPDCACSPRRRTLCRCSRDFSRPSEAEVSAVVPAAAPMVVSFPRLDPSARVVRRTGRYGAPAPQDDRPPAISTCRGTRKPLTPSGSPCTAPPSGTPRTAARRRAGHRRAPFPPPAAAPGTASAARSWDRRTRPRAPGGSAPPPRR